MQSSRWWRSALVVIGIFVGVQSARGDAISDYPILFVTQVPNPQDFGTMAATFGNHIANPNTAVRGGDLWIRYPDGTLKNLTSAAGYGTTGFQGAQAIAVRDPAVHWDGTKALFSMVVGNPTQRYQVITARWQLYEITGLGFSDTPVITKVANQPATYNNHSPTYTSDDAIIFVSDRPRDDTVLHTYPQRDEYESSPVNSGLWKLVPTTGALTILDHAPSGDFNPIVDSFGRVIFTRWDHLQRDQQNIGASMGAYNFSTEASTTPLSTAAEVFPEPRSIQDPNYSTKVNLFTINQFFPWMMHQDGRELETLNHVGRQEIGLYSERSFNDDANVQEFYGQYSTGANQNEFTIFLHIKEKPTEPGTYVGTSCQEFGTHSSGQILTINGAPGVNPDAMTVTYLTHPDTAGASDTPSGNHSGLYRDPLPLSNGTIVASHTANTRQDSNIGTESAPLSRYDFRLKVLTQSGSYFTAGTTLTSGITKSVSYWNPDSMVSYSGTLWEMMPVEVRSRTRPTAPSATIPTPEQQVLTALDINEENLRSYLTAHNLALIVSRNVTMRDRNDRQQPYNLRITGTTTQSIPKSGKIYDISHLQLFQGDLVRGYTSNSGTGRRVLAQEMHSVESGINPELTGAPQGAVQLAEDGSMAAFVPAQRALTWQLTDPSGAPVVRERYWVTFQPGEIRVCASCHGINTADHTGKTAPTNAPLALTRLLQHWKGLPQTPTTPSDSSGSSVSLTVRTTPSLQPGAKLTVTAQGGTASDQLEVTFSLNNKRCAKVVSLPKNTTSRSLKGRIPSAKAVLWTLGVRKNGATTLLAQKSIRIGKGARRLTARSRTDACRALASSMRKS